MMQINNFEYTSNDIPPKTESFQLVLDEIFTPRNGYIRLFNQIGFFALIDTRSEQIWFKNNYIPYSLNHHISQIYATNAFALEMIKNTVAEDLRTWLWQVISHSNGLIEQDIDTNAIFKLNIWPKFENNTSRREYLKIAACFSMGAKVKDVEQYLGLPPEQITKFVAMAQSLRLGEFIEANQAKFIFDQAENVGQMNKLRSFFGKLRQKLGL